MKRLTIVLLALVCLGTLSAEAQGRRSRRQRVQEEVVDTVPNQAFSYAYGQLNTTGLNAYLASRMGVDTTRVAAFLHGFDGGVADDEFIASLKAFVAGAEIRQQIETGICPGIDRQLSGNDSVRVLDRVAFVQGFRDAFTGTAQFTADSAAVCVEKNTKYHVDQLMNALYGEWRQQNVDYLTANARNRDVHVTESGLQYKVIEVGTGETPTATNRVKVNYEGKLIDGTVFDSSYQRNQPATFACNQVISGWTEALTMMPVGSKWELVIPSDLGYGEREMGNIKPYSTLIFTVELMSIEP